MNSKEAYKRVCKEYLSKCKECDGCIAQIYCITNNLRTDRYPQDDCCDKLMQYLKNLK